MNTTDKTTAPLYRTVHSTLAARGPSTAKQLAESLSLTPTQVVGSLVQLGRFGAVKRLTRGVYEAVALDFQARPSGRRRSASSFAASVAKFLSERGPSSMGQVLDGFCSKDDPRAERDKVRARVASSLIELRKTGQIVATGERGSFLYAVVRLADEAAA